MRDTATQGLMTALRELKMFGMAQAVGDLAEQGAPAFEAAQPFLAQLLKAESAEREVRAVAYQLKQARFPVYRDLAGFDFANSEVNEALVKQLHRGEFMDRAENVVLVGGPGTGKTHLATAIGVPPMAYRSLAPFGQLEYESGSLTLRGGLRDEHSRLKVADYSTLAFYGNRAVQGGERSASKLVKNLGAVWRFGRSGCSSFVSYNEGFGSPDVGLILRAVNSAGRSVNTLVDLLPILTDNREIGIAWRGAEGSVSASVYRSHSDLGSQLVVSNGIGSLQRVPITVRGFEVSGDWRPARDWLLNASYAQTRGRTASAAGGVLDLDLGARSQGPDKLVLGAQWRPAPGWQARWTQSAYFSRAANLGKFSGKTALEERFKGYTVADLALSWDSPWGRLGAGLENLFNRRYLTYYAQANYSGTAEDFYAGRGRSLTLSWQRSF